MENPQDEILGSSISASGSTKPLIYLASPFRDQSWLVQELRYREVSRRAGLLLRQGHNVFSPIAHGRSICNNSDLPGTYEQWESLNRQLLSRSDALWIADMPGWNLSRGVTAEILHAEQLHLPIKLVTADNVLLDLLDLPSRERLV